MPNHASSPVLNAATESGSQPTGSQPAGAAGNTVVINGTTYTQQQVDDVTKFQSDRGVVLIVRDGTSRMRLLIEGAQICLNAGASGDYGLMHTGAQKVVAGIYVAFGLRPGLNVDTQGAPQQAGLVDATNTAVAIMRDRPKVAEATDLDPNTLEEQGRQCGFTIAMTDLFAVSQKFSTNLTVPLSRVVADGVRQVGGVIQNDAARDLDLGVQSEPIFSYLKDASKKGATTKRKIKKIKGKVAQQTTAEVGAQARTQAQATVQQQMNDLVQSYLKDHSK